MYRRLLTICLFVTLLPALVLGLSLMGSVMTGVSHLILTAVEALIVRNPSSSVVVSDVTEVIGPIVSPGGAGEAQISTTIGSCTSGNCGVEGGQDVYPLRHEGTPDTNETTVEVADPTADRTITFPNASGEVSLLGQSITDAEVDDTITLTNMTQITNRAITSLTATCTDGQVVGGNAAGTAVECQTDDDAPEAGDFAGALALEADGSLSVNTVGPNQLVDGDYGGISVSGHVVNVESLQSGTVFPATPAEGELFRVTSDSVTGACDAAGGTAVSVCFWSTGQWRATGSDFIRNQQADCSGSVSIGLWCIDTDNGEVYVGNGTTALRVNAAAQPPGSSGQVVFNDGGSYGADTGLTYNKTTDTLTAAGGIVVPCDTATQECLTIFPNETVDISAASAANTCNFAPVNGALQYFCNGSTRRTVATTADIPVALEDRVAFIFNCQDTNTTDGTTFFLARDSSDSQCNVNETASGNNKPSVALPYNGVADSLTCEVTVAPGAAQSITATLRFAGVNTDVSVAISGTGLGPVNDTTGTTVYTAGQRITMSHVTSAGAADVGFTNCVAIIRRTP